MFNDTDKSRVWKTPLSGRKCILTVYVIIELDSEAFRTSSPAGEPLTFISIYTRCAVRSNDLGQPTPADRAHNPVNWLINNRS